MPPLWVQRGVPDWGLFASTVIWQLAVLILLMSFYDNFWFSVMIKRGDSLRRRPRGRKGFLFAHHWAVTLLAAWFT